MKRLFYTTFLGFLFSISFLVAQNRFSEDSSLVRKKYSQALSKANVLTLITQQYFIDSLSNLLSTAIATNTTSIQAFCDSLILSSKEFLDSSRIDSAYQLHKEFSGKLKNYGKMQKQVLDRQLDGFQRLMKDLMIAHQTCSGCSGSEDYESGLSTFLDDADNSSQTFHDSISDLWSEIPGTITDSAAALRDSLEIYIETLIENRDTQLDSIEHHSSHFIASIDANSYASYHGRDGGISQSSVSPLITYRHATGIKLALGVSWMEDQEKHWDAIALGAGYEFMFSQVLGGSIGYTHLWFDSSSAQVRSVFNNNIGAGLDLSISVADVSFNAGIDFSDKSEYYFQFTTTHTWHIGRTITVAPAILGVWGEQNQVILERQQELVQKQNKKGKIVTKTVTTKMKNSPKDIFSILDYELSLPVSIRFGRFVFIPSVTAVCPMDVLDGGRDLPFLNAKFTVVMDQLL
ncbi:MAG: hypothetical protein ABSC53_00665 [Bacteroidota bacterium]|jgi:hypothetical protein